jgi:hypothetical protein
MSVLTVRNAADFLIVLCAAVPGIDDHRPAGQVTHGLRAIQQPLMQLQAAAAAAFELLA